MIGGDFRSGKPKIGIRLASQKKREQENNQKKENFFQNQEQILPGKFKFYSLLRRSFP